MEEAGFAHGVQLMQSSGGMATVEAAAQRPVNLLMSGPVAGLIGGIWAARMSGYEDVVTLDIGGTSADIGVAADGQLRMRHLLDTKVGDYQAMVPMVDIDTIGAGGGSIAYVDDGGVFRVGPQSAGADPGPACYGRGGTEPTSTDAQLVLGRLRPERGLLGGEMQLDRRARRAPRCSALAERLGMTVEEAALGALQIQKYGMTQAIELNSVRRGYDPREFTLVAAGGAGPLFACDIALELEIPHVLVPPHPGIIAATGLLATDIQHEFVATERHLAGGARPGAPRRRASTSSSTAGDRSSSSATRCRRTRAWYAGSPTAATSARATRSASTCPPARSTTPGSRELAEAFHRAHEARVRPSLRRARSRSSTSASSRIGRVEPLQWSELEAGDGDPSRCPHGRARGRLRGRRPPERHADAVLRARELRAGRPHRGSGDDRAVRHDDARPARARGRRSTASATS